jgi:inner membrane protein
MPYPVSHAAAGVAVALVLSPVPPTRRLLVTCAVLGVIPDLDIVAVLLGASNKGLLGHRGFTHSLSFAALSGVVATLLIFRGAPWAPYRFRIWLVSTLAMATHGALDALTSYGYGVAFFSPWSMQRYRLPWQPLTGQHWPWGAFWNEIVWVFLPSLVVIGLALWIRRRNTRASSA